MAEVEMRCFAADHPSRDSETALITIADLDDHDADLGDHDGPILVITMPIWAITMDRSW
jgi:hypothetical protein